MTLFLASDHAGFELKERLKKALAESGYTIEDCGAYRLDPADDYPDFIKKAALAVSNDPQNNRAIILGGSGQGEAMVANRYKNVRAAVYYGPSVAPQNGAMEGKGEKIIVLSREHNDANVLSLGARFLSTEQAVEAVKLWLATPFSGDARHARRIGRIDI